LSRRTTLTVVEFVPPDLGARTWVAAAFFPLRGFLTEQHKAVAVFIHLQRLSTGGRWRMPEFQLQ
jgi:hypothetical protein